MLVVLLTKGYGGGAGGNEPWWSRGGAASERFWVKLGTGDRIWGKWVK